MVRNEIKNYITWQMIMINLCRNRCIEFGQSAHSIEELLHQIILPNSHAIFIRNIIFTFSDPFMAKSTKLLERYWSFHMGMDNHFASCCFWIFEHNKSFSGLISYHSWCKWSRAFDELNANLKYWHLTLFPGWFREEVQNGL